MRAESRAVFATPDIVARGPLVALLGFQGLARGLVGGEKLEKREVKVARRCIVGTSESRKAKLNPENTNSARF